MLAHSDASLANILPIDYFKFMPMCITKGYTKTSLDLNQSIRLPLRCALHYLNSKADIANARWHPVFPIYQI